MQMSNLANTQLYSTEVILAKGLTIIEGDIVMLSVFSR